MEAITNFLDRIKDRKRRIAVVGDGMIDEYFQVSADRVSPEFPIPVMLSSDQEPNISLPGGAGNVCSQFKHFPCEVDFYGMVDTYARTLFAEHGINTDNCVNLLKGRNPIKKRIYQGDFPLCRWDIEKEGYGQDVEDLRKRLFTNFEGAFPYHVVIFSDYDKGVFGDPQIWLQRELNPITIVDPKNRPLEDWKGCSIIKPNAKEARKLTGADDWEEQVKIIAKATGCTAVIITQGGDGVVGAVHEKPFEYRPSKKVTADSVIGAGDCFVAFLAMALAYEMDLVKAVEVAFEAGAISVQKKNTDPLTPMELLQRADPVKAKFVSREFLKERDFTLSFSNGVFDLIHSGHIATLRTAKSLSDKLVVAVNSDESTSKLKPGRPIMPLEERMSNLAALEFVDYVVSFEEDTPLQAIRDIVPDKIVKGGDYVNIEDVVGVDVVGKDNVVLGPHLNVSTTSIIKRIKNV